MRSVVGLLRSCSQRNVDAAYITTATTIRHRGGARRAVRRLHASHFRGKIQTFDLPDIGEGIAEVEILAWHVKPGDRVAQFDKLLEVQSDKANVDITSRYDGVVVSLKYGVGEMAPTGKPLLEIEVADDGAIADGTSHGASGGTPEKGDVASTLSRNVDGGGDAGAGDLRALATPAVRRLAREHQLSIASIPSTGKGGRVTKEDVLRFIDKLGPSGAPVAELKTWTPPVQSPAATGARMALDDLDTDADSVDRAVASPAATLRGETVKSATAPLQPSSASRAAPLPPLRGPPQPGSTAFTDRLVPVRGIQRAMAKSMTAAWQAPHFGLNEEVIVDALMDLRQSLRPMAEARGLKFTYMPLLLKAASLALSAHPELNALISPDASDVTLKGHHNIGIAIDTKRGLLVPNVKAVQTLSVLEIAQELARIQSLAAEGKLGAEDLTDGTFTLSNIGNLGGTYASPVLFAPQVAIGAVGRIARLPRYASTLAPACSAAIASRTAGSSGGSGDAVVPAHVMYVSWAADHRVVDGATMARFSNVVKGFLESPSTMLAHLR